MPELRAVLVLVPPLLADLIRQVLATRGLEVRIAAELSDPRIISTEMAALSAHVALLGSTDLLHLVGGSLSSETRILSLSRDLTELIGPGDRDRVPFTADNLVKALRDIRNDLDPTPPP